MAACTGGNACSGWCLELEFIPVATRSWSPEDVWTCEGAAVAGADPTVRWPSVCAVVPTRDRPALLQRAVTAILDQDYPGALECVVVFDQSEPCDLDIPPRPGRTITRIRNARTPGLAGARNSGVLHAQSDLVAFCDDDDEWLPEKLCAQVSLLLQHPDTSVVATGILVNFQGQERTRLAPDRPLTQRDFLRDRLMEVNPCTVVARRAAVLENIGLVDETIPGGYGEDYEWLLRASCAGTIRSVPRPLVRVNWHAASFFADRWRTIIAALQHLLEHYPQFEDEPAGLARIEGQIAFAYAGIGDRAAARSWARQALSHSMFEQRAYVALLCSTGLVSNDAVVALAHRAGRGI